MSRGTLHRILEHAGLSWKKCKKLFSKADHDQRLKFIADFQAMFKGMIEREVVVIYVDEAHIHRDLRTGYSWGRIGERIWRASDSPGLSERVNWYGAYNFSTGQCMIWSGGKCNGEQTCRFLEHVAEWARESGKQVIIIWDGAPWHRAGKVQVKAAELKLTLKRLPGYSPDLNPIEGLWKWMREDVTQHYCHKTLEELAEGCQKFIERINKDAQAIVDRLAPKFELDPEYEKLLVST